MLLFCGGIAAFVLYYLALQDLGLREYWAGFFAWWQSGCPVLRPYSENGALELVRLLTVFVPAGIIWLYYRRLFYPASFLFICIGFGALTGWLYISENEHLITVLALLSIALLTGLARICGGSITKRLGREKTVSVSLMQLCALVLASAAAVFSVLVIPKKHVSGWYDAKDEGDAALAHLMRAAATVAKMEGLVESGFRVVSNCGPDAQQSVPHLHLHVLGGRAMSGEMA